MNKLTPVAFSKARGHEPRLSEPYVPGRRHPRFWSESEKDIVREHYPTGGAPACLAHLPPHRTPSGVYGLVAKLKIAKTGDGEGPRTRIEVPEDIDDRIRDGWALLDGRKKGEVAQFADDLGVPRWWLSKRLIALGLAVKHRKEPPWTDAEKALMHKVPLHDPERAAAIFREHGFNRSPTAIAVRAKRQGLSRRTHETLSASGAAKILGIDNKSVAALCISGELKATRRNDRRLPQQGGPAWAIEPLDLRAYIVENIDRIDIRKVDKVAFVDLLVSAPAEPPDTPAVAGETPRGDPPVGWQRVAARPARKSFAHEAETIVGDLERTFAAAGISFEYLMGPEARAKPYVVGGCRMSLQGARRLAEREAPGRGGAGHGR